MNKGFVLILGILLWLGSVDMFSQETVEAIVAIVNDDVITLSDYQQEHDLLVQTLRVQIPKEDFEEQYKKLRAELLENMITNRLLMQEATRLGIEVTDQINMTIEHTGGADTWYLQGAMIAPVGVSSAGSGVVPEPVASAEASGGEVSGSIASCIAKTI